MLAPVIGAPLTWRIGMTAPAIERAGAVSIQMDMPASPIKMAPARSRAPRPSKVFPFQIARRSSGYPSGVPIEAGKGGNVCPIVNRMRTIVEPASPASGPFLGTCSVAESRIHRSGSVETNREKVAAPATSSQSAGPAFRCGRQRDPAVLLDEYDDQPTLRFSADSFPRLATTS
jgi:hypothetical protein